MSKKPKVLLTSFDRLEKILLFNLLRINSVEIVGIVSDHDPDFIAKFIEYDSNHGKFTDGKISVKNTKTEKKIMIQSANSANIKIFSPSVLNKKLIQKNEIDIIITLSTKNKKEEVNKLQKLGAKVVLTLANTHIVDIKNFELVSFGLNHQEIDLSKNKTFMIPPIEATVGALINQRVEKYNSSIELYFQIIRGPSKEMNLLDTLSTPNKTGYFRSVINNIIPNNKKFVQTALERMLRESKTALVISGDMVRIPVTTGSLMTLVFQGKKIVKKSELVKVLKEVSDDLIGYTSHGLVSQDVVSCQQYGIIDEDLLSCLNSKDLSVVKLGVWYDYESSLAINVLKLLLYISGLPEFV